MPSGFPLKGFLEADEALPGGKIPDYSAFSEPFKQSRGLFSEIFVDFDYAESARPQEAGGPERDGAIEEQRVAVGHEQGDAGLVFKDVAVHRGLFAFAYIRRVGYDDIERRARACRRC